ncbi:protein FAM117A-like isoform X2 [Thalassophryne amazonica]|uniref:protein FAM117A-like isoform X2 n=1 Tax=Thalassophryne amazonica TaxID=390379 RepID=UPI0014710F95|nr:protein FAM117A-like isoform X2 [Thalassophryne amazonica]
MSGRSGAAQTRGTAVGPQPLKATVPYRLASKPRPNWRAGKSGGKAKSPQLSSGMRRTVSLDAIIGPYLQGHWPKEPESQSGLCRKDKSTQTPDSWSEKTRSRRSSSSHKRSASCGSTEHLEEVAKLKQLQQRPKPVVPRDCDKDCQHSDPQGSCSLGTTQTKPIPIPAFLSTLVPPLHCSVEGLNQELEGMFICQSQHHQHRLLEVPDGHRAPVPPQSCSTGCQSCHISTPLSPSPTSSSPCSSPTNISTFSPSPKDVLADLHQGSVDGNLLSPCPSHSEADLSAPLQTASSPRPNKSYCFQREPPEGCEKVRVWEETRASHQPTPPFISSCPDPNKVNFTPYGGSAFCPVNLLKPLLPSMDLFFRSLAVSPSSFSNQATSSCQATSSGNQTSPSGSPVTTMGDCSGEGLAF